MTTYSISLDDVDLALMPLYTSYNNFLRKEHYQFEVKKTVTFEVPEPSTLYTCHICAIVMPAAFAREHATSVKHRANARIASIAAQRLCALVSALPPPSTALTARFCANCATVADDDHYRTREHRDAVAHDNLLWDLMKAYAQESPDDDPKYDQDCSDNQSSPNNSLDKNNDHMDDLEFKNDGHNTNNNSMAAPAIDKNQPTEPIGEKEHKPIEEEHIPNNCEINNLKEHNDDHKTDDINDNISTSNSTKANVTVVEVKSDILIEYPYEVTATGHTYCVVCECKVPGSAHNREEHVKGSKHCKKVISQSQPTQPIKDEKEEQTEENGIDDNLEEYNEDEEFSDDNNSKGSNLYEANDEDVIDGTLEAYTEDEEFTDGITDNISTNINKPKDAVTMKTSDLKVDTQIVYPYDLTATGMGHVRCIVCDCKVPRGEHTKEEHIRGLKHRRMVISQSQPTQPIKDEKEEQTEENGIDDNLEEYSEDEEFSDDNNSKGSNLNEANDEDMIDESQIEYPIEVTATGVDCEVPNFEQSRNDHVQGRTHRNMMNRKNESIYEEEEEHIAEDCETNESFEEYSEDKEFDNNDNNNMRTDIQYPFKIIATGVDCVVCNCHVPNHEHNRIEHIRGWRHRNMVISQSQPTQPIKDEKEEQTEENGIDDNLEEYSEDEEFSDDNNLNEANDEDMIDESQIEYPIEVTATGVDWKVPNFEQSRNDHVQGWTHRNMMNRENESIYEEEEEHIAEDCETNESFEEYSEDKELDNNDNNNMRTDIQYPFKVTATGVDCVVCNCHVPNHEHNRIEHIRGWRHRNMVISQSQRTQPIKDEKEDQTEGNGIDDNLEEYSEVEEFSDDNNGMGSNLYEANDEDVINETQIEYPFEVTATGVDCVVCDCEVPNFELSRNEHVQGQTHRNMMKRENESIYEEEHMAEVCETNESFEEYSKDKEFDNNGNNNTRTDIQYPFKVTATGVDCVVCNCHVPNHEHNRIEHIRGWRHRNMVISQSQPTQPIKDEKEEQTEENGIDDNLEEYNEDEEFSDDNNSKGSNLYEANDEDVIDETQIEYPFIVIATGVDCVVCNCHVPNHEHNRIEHIRGWRHRNMMNRVNGSIDEEEEQIAEACETNDSFEEYSEDEELDNNDHESSSSITAHSQIEYPFEVTATGQVECVICDCKVLGNVHNREEHINGMRHRSMVTNQPEEETQSPDNSEICESSEHSEDEELTDDNSDI